MSLEIKQLIQEYVDFQLEGFLETKIIIFQVKYFLLSLLHLNIFWIEFYLIL
jgi:hypothetical protein